MTKEKKYQITDLTELEYTLIINSLKVFRGDWNKAEESHNSVIWQRELTILLTKLGYPGLRWDKESIQ